MSLRSKIVLILSLVMASYAGADFAIQKFTVARGFSVLERDEAEKDVLRVVEALRKEIADLHQASRNWSAWDEMYDFVGSQSVAFQKANLGSATLRNHEIDLLFICDSTGKYLFRHLIDPDTDKHVALRDFPDGITQLHATHPILTSKAHGETAQGLFLTELKPMLVSARPILTSKGEGPSKGTVIVGRFLSNNFVATLTKQTHVGFDFWQMDPRHELPPEAEQIRDELTASARAVLKESNDGSQLYAYRTFNDFRGRPDFLLRANVVRRITAAGVVAVRYALISTLAASLILLLVLMGLLQRVVLSPLSMLTRHVLSIGKNEDFRAKLHLKRDDEVGMLSNEFDNMMDKLEKARAALVDAARTAGKSEIATGILHNVGNVLNSVNVSTTLLTEKVNAMRINDIETLSRILSEHATRLAEFIERDPRGKHVQPALAAVTQHLTAQRDGILTELSSLNDGIICIRELVKSQQSFAVQAVLEEPASIPEQIKKAIALTNKASAHDAELKIEHNYASVPDVMVDKHRLLEILVNVIQNARQAIDMAEGNSKKITIVVRESASDRMQIEIADSGVGIPAENLNKIFNLGFTTKPSGHGFGLHAAANAATEMGGSLTARSDGPGRGATFILEIPKNTCAAPAAAETSA